jgi:festuclavine dehydrogenase
MPIEEANAADLTNDFVTYAAKEKGVKRFVLLTGTTATKDGPRGDVWRKLDELGVEYSIFRATWFTGMSFSHFLTQNSCCVYKRRRKVMTW